jgi:arylsulfatase A-like enzyme
MARRAVVISFDRLHAGFLGCYGNDWIETPNLDRLATESVVFDQHFCDNLDPLAANHAWWTGAPQFALDEFQQRRSPSSIDVLHSRGVRTCLVVESDGRDDMAVAPPFGEVLTVAGKDGFDVQEGETPFARVVNRCADWLNESARQEGAALLWIKSRGVPEPWVPPRPFAELYLDEFGLTDDDEDQTDADVEASDTNPPAPPETAHTSTGPDRSLDWRYAAAMYAAYTTLLDRGMGKLLATFAATRGWERMLLVVAAGAGQPLGEHASIAEDALPLRSEAIQAPLWVCVPGSDQAGTRRQCLVQSTDLAPTLWEWLCGDGPDVGATEQSIHDTAGMSLLPWIRNEGVAPREFVILGNSRSEWGIRTPNFFYVEPGDRRETDAAPAQLFEKPHDRWDQSDVLSQYPQVADELQSTLRRQVEVLTGR